MQPRVLGPAWLRCSLANSVKFVAYSATVCAFLVGWIGVALLVRKAMADLLPGDYGEPNWLVDWLELPGCVLGLPVGVFLAWLIGGFLKRDKDR